MGKQTSGKMCTLINTTFSQIHLNGQYLQELNLNVGYLTANTLHIYLQALQEKVGLAHGDK
jgi:hypothetical protein